MSTTFWAVFTGALSAYLVIQLIEGIIDEYYARKHATYLEHLEDVVDDLTKV